MRCARRTDEDRNQILTCKSSISLVEILSGGSFCGLFYLPFNGFPSSGLFRFQDADGDSTGALAPSIFASEYDFLLFDRRRSGRPPTGHIVGIAS